MSQLGFQSTPFSITGISDFILSNEDLSKSKRRQDILYGILDHFTGEQILLSKIIVEIGQEPIIDNIIYFKSGVEFFKRVFSTIDAKWFGAKGDIITDDTLAIKTALSFAEKENGKISFNGNFLIKEKLTIIDQGIVELSGNGKNSSSLIFDISNGFAIESQSYYSRLVTIKDITIQAKNQDINISGVKVSNPFTWGSGINMENVDIRYFGKIGLHLQETFNSKFSNCMIYGAIIDNIKTTTLVKLTKVDSFGSEILFENCVLQIGKIGIQNNGANGLKFDTCTFEALRLFHNIEQIPFLSMNEVFDNCWFEQIESGIVNSKIDEATLLPVLPIENKAEISRLVFRNNFESSGVVAEKLNANIEPYLYNKFNFLNGDLKINEKSNSAFTYNYSNENAPNSGVINTITRFVDLTDISFGPFNAFKAGAMLITVQVIGFGGSKMTGIFITSNYQTDCVLQGSIKDVDSIGVASAYKIQCFWSDSLTLIVQAEGNSLVSVKAHINLLLN